MTLEVCALDSLYDTEMKAVTRFAGEDFVEREV